MNKLKELRLSAKLTQEKLAELSGISIRTIQDYEQGAKISYVSNLYRLAKALKCTMEELLKEE